VDTGVANSVVADGLGLYRASSLEIGKYEIEVKGNGFKTGVAGPITLNVGQNKVVDFALELGKVSETVDVTTGVPQVDTTDNTLAWLVGQKQVEDLPLNGRNVTQLILLAPGIQPVPQESTEGAATLVPFGFGSPQRFSVAGGRPQGQLFLLDGTDTAGVWGNGSGLNLAGTSLGVDGIAEFQAFTDTYSANYGGNGGVVNSALRAGTNELHGSAYEFARNSAMDTRNYFDPPGSKLPFSRNQFGGTLGGPIVKDSTFFFFNYEQLQQTLTTPVTTIVPDANFRNGYLPCYETFGEVCGPNNLADVGVAPAIAGYLNTFPAPNGGEIYTLINGVQTPTGTADAVSDLKQPAAEHYGVAKLTRTLSRSDSLSASYLVDDGQLTVFQNPTLEDNDTERNQYVTIEESKVISPALLNVAHFAYARSHINVGTVFNPALTVVPGSGFNANITVLGLSQIGGADTAEEALNRYTLRDQVSFIKGRNSIEAGMEVVRHALGVNIPIITGGEVLYEGLGALGLPIGPYQSFLQNEPLVFAGVPLNEDDSRRDIRHTNLSPYFQDKFQVSPRLTLNAGLRYDFETNPTETHNKLYNLLDPLTSTGFTQVPHAFQTNPTKSNFEPRIGFAWDVNGDHKTSVRGGFGIFDDLPLEMQVAIDYLFNPPIYNVQEIFLPTIPNPFNVGGINVTGLPGTSQGTSYNVKKNDYIMQYNLIVQRDLSHNTVLTVGYVGSKANHLFIGQETNGCEPTGELPNGLFVRNYANTATCPVANPALSSVVLRYPVGSSNYNSLEVSVDRGVGQYVQFRAAYTYSKCLDVGSYYTGNDSIGPNGATAGLQAGSLASSAVNVDYGPCDYDLRSNFTTNALFDLPFKGNRFKDGWQITAIGSVHSGTPFSVYDGIDQANVGAAGAAENAERPDLRPGANANPTGRREINGHPYWFDNSSSTSSPFVLQPSGIFGNLGRNTLVAPNYRDLDIGVSKNTTLSERTKLQLRADAFNATNHTNLGFPNANLFADPGAAGQISSTQGFQREIQLSAKFTF
jgi:hypothetical protein